MRDGCAGVSIAEYVCMGPSMYSICLEKDPQMHQKICGQKHMRHEQYKETLFDRSTLRRGMAMLRNERHHIYGMYVNNVPLSPFYSKRWN